jgi:hypothetical protein
VIMSALFMILILSELLPRYLPPRHRLPRL